MNSPGSSVSPTDSRHADRRPIVYVIALLFLSVIVTLTFVAVADIYLHFRQGMNFQGYRGPSVGKKQPGEVRIAVVGGSTTWGYGLPWDQSFPAQLNGLLRKMREETSLREASVLNLGFNNEGAYSFKYTLKDYEHLDYDVVIIYSGYNDQGIEPNRSVFRADSPLFALTGYMPLLPSFVREKYERIMALFSKPSGKTVFVMPSEAQLKGQSNEAVARSLETQMDSISKLAPSRQIHSESMECGRRWSFYCEQIRATIDFSLARGKRVVVVTEPYIGSIYIDQQRALTSMLANRYLNRHDVHHINLGLAVDLRDPELCWDGMHLTEKGNRVIAEALASFLSLFLRR